MRILYVDSGATAESVCKLLVSHKYTVDLCTDGAEAFALACDHHYDGIVLERDLAEMDELTLVTQLRQRGLVTPIMFFSCRASVEDRIAGLNAGADDYLRKPSTPAELLARVRALMRRRGTFFPDVLEASDLTLDLRTATLNCSGKSEPLSRLEYQIMELFMRHPGMTFSAPHLLEQVWGVSAESDVGAVWVYISYLRRKLSGLGTNVVIRSRCGVGYTLEVEK